MPAFSNIFANSTVFSISGKILILQVIGVVFSSLETVFTKKQIIGLKDKIIDNYYWITHIVDQFPFIHQKGAVMSPFGHRLRTTKIEINSIAMRSRQFCSFQKYLAIICAKLETKRNKNWFKKVCLTWRMSGRSSGEVWRHCFRYLIFLMKAFALIIGV